MILAKQIIKYFSISFICIIYFACNPIDNNSIITGSTMGTIYTITILDFEHNNEEFKNQIDSVLQNINDHFSTYIDDSEISIINNSTAELINVSDQFRYVLNTALYYSELSNGSYDITVNPLVELWGFGNSTTNSIPNINQINNIVSSIGYEKISLNNNDEEIFKFMILDEAQNIQLLEKDPKVVYFTFLILSLFLSVFISIFREVYKSI